MPFSLMVKHIVYGLMLMIVSFAPIHASTTAKWTLHSDKNHIKIYTQTLAVGIKVKAVTDIKASLGALLALLEDTNQAPTWIANCKKVVIEAAPSPYERRVHVYYNAPWPVRDRDMVTYSIVKLDQDGLGYQIEIKDEGHNFPIVDKYVRMKHVQGTWTVRNIGSGIVRVSYEGSGDASGKIPRWMSDNLLIKSTTKTFENLRDILSKSEYQVSSSYLDQFEY